MILRKITKISCKASLLSFDTRLIRAVFAAYDNGHTKEYLELKALLRAVCRGKADFYVSCHRAGKTYEVRPEICLSSSAHMKTKGGLDTIFG